MKKVIGLLVTLALFGLSPTAFGVPLNIDSYNCTGGLLTDIVSTADVTGNQGGSSECFGTLDGNDPGPSGDGLEINGMLFEFISKVDEENGSLVHSGADIGLSITGDGGLPASSGTWSYDSSLFAADAFVIVIKAANTPGWAAWLFEGPDTQHRMRVPGLSPGSPMAVLVQESNPLAIVPISPILVYMQKMRAYRNREQ
ncbi:hypothetical protein MnTg04_00022 [bacterium MnTg04]|nr:hypothetical protein MnTg04_00022 [bacterium MnTg04]